MQFKCGTDIIEISRIRDSINEHKDGFLSKIYTKNEVDYCESKGMQKYQHYAARFAVKEAAFKAISELLEDKYELEWTDYEVINDQNGRPHLKLPTKYINQIESIDISISHCKEYAVASVTVLLK